MLATASGTPQHVATLTLCHGAMSACFYAATAVVVLPIRGFHRLVRSGLGMTGWPECHVFLWNRTGVSQSCGVAQWEPTQQLLLVPGSLVASLVDSPRWLVHAGSIGMVAWCGSIGMVASLLPCDTRCWPPAISCFSFQMDVIYLPIIDL